MSDLTPQTVNEVVPLPVQIIAGILRAGLTGLAGILATAGALTGDQQTQFVTIGGGLALWLATVAWSAIQKHNAKKPA